MPEREDRVDDVLLAAAVRSWDAEVKNFDRYMTRVNLTITIGLALAALAGKGFFDALGGARGPTLLLTTGLLLILKAVAVLGLNLQWRRRELLRLPLGEAEEESADEPAPVVWASSGLLPPPFPGSAAERAKVVEQVYLQTAVAAARLFAANRAANLRLEEQNRHFAAGVVLAFLGAVWYFGFGS